MSSNPETGTLERADSSAESPLKEALYSLKPFWVLERQGVLSVVYDSPPGKSLAYCPALRPENLGDRSFLDTHGLRYAYVTGAMANGIGSVELVAAMSKAGMLGVFGAAGLSVPSVEKAIDRLQDELGTAPFGSNLIHSPNEPATENAVAELYLRRGVHLVEASAYLDITQALVRYRVTGLKRGPGGEVIAPNRVIAKVSRTEVATRFFSPAPDRLLRPLVEKGLISQEEAELAGEIPVAQDLTGEADSGGHTDNRPLVTLLPTLLALRDQLQERFRFREPLRVGAAGGISTPVSAAAAFQMGAAYVLTGSINQACVESGSSDVVRGMLAQAQQADTAMAPAADMFEMGVRVQVLKRGTLFAMRAAKLYEIYRAYGSLEEIPAAARQSLERDLFRQSLDEIWSLTREFFLKRDPSQVERADRDGKHKMALVFRWYLGLASRWANAGEPTRQPDYQVWCGPAMGAFNEWAKGTSLEPASARRVVPLAQNILYGAAVQTRLHILRCQGVRLDASLSRVLPREPKFLEEWFNHHG